MKLNFTECKTMITLYNFEGNIRMCGGKIITKELNTLKNTGSITFEVDNVKEFEEKFKLTNAYKFLDQKLWKPINFK